MNYLRSLLCSIAILLGAQLMHATWYAYNPLDFTVDVMSGQASHSYGPKAFQEFPDEFLKQEIEIKGKKGIKRKINLKEISAQSPSNELNIIVFKSDDKDASGINYEYMTAEAFKKSFNEAYEKNKELIESTQELLGIEV